MGIRKLQFQSNEYYHVFNRGVDKRDIFIEQGDLFYFFQRLIDLNSEINFGHQNKRNIEKNKEQIKDTKKLVSIISYCLLPNHFHLILKEESEHGISKFMQKLGTSYTKYFNKKYERSGGLFQGKFKATHITGNISLSTLSVYVNLNYKHHGIDPKSSLVKTSLYEYLGTEKYDSICQTDDVLSTMGSVEEYIKFLKTTEQSFIENKVKESPNKIYLLEKITYCELEN